MLRLIPLLLLTALLGASDAVDDFGIPDWILPGILMVESGSFYTDDSSSVIRYINRHVGEAGELGCCQITMAAFATVSEPGESFQRCAKDSAFCEQIAARYLIYLHHRFGTWDRAVQSYNAGHPCRAGRRYLAKIKRIITDIRN